jgi:hypothetical protein
MAQVAGQLAVAAGTKFLTDKFGGGSGNQKQGGGTASILNTDLSLPNMQIADTKIGTLPDPSLQNQAALWDIANKQAEYNQYVSAALDRTQRKFYTDQDIRRQRAVGTESRLNYMVQGEQERAGKRIQGQEDRAQLAESGAQGRASARVAGQEQRAGFAEQGSQQRASARVAGQEQRAGFAEQGTQQRSSARVAGQEQRAGMSEEGTQTRASARVAGQEQRAGIAEGGTQTRATKRVEGQEVRATDLQREMFRRYKEARDYGQAQSAYKA